MDGSTQIKFGTKAETLSALSGRLTTASVLPQLSFTVKDWVNSNCRFNCLPVNNEPWLKQDVVVRSSAIAEDTQTESLAGHFNSILDVNGQVEIEQAINDVITSFGKGCADDDQILIQPMLLNVTISGVVFSRDPANGGHYYVVNYDDHSGKTDTVTDGSTNDLTVYYAAKSQSANSSGWLKELLTQLQELEELFQHDSLDLEFAVNANEELFILQLRPLIIRQQPTINLSDQKILLQRIEKKITSLSNAHPYLLGKRTVFGVMPDWNPAEIIGIRPRPLSLSLYKEIITDNIWAYQRDNYGYRNLRSFPLLTTFAGLPYIDVRISFNSFIPSDLDKDLAERLTDYYLDYLAENPESHDKIEFDIIFSCYTLDLPERLRALEKSGFTKLELNKISDSLRRLTNTIIHDENGLWRKDISKLTELRSRQITISESSLSPVDKIYWLLEDCKRYGTLPFAGLARAGFIAVQLLRSLTQTGILTTDDYNCFLQSLTTVSSTMYHDLRTMARDVFLQKYGHLRPGTYDILSFRYDEQPDQYFDWQQRECSEASDEKEFSLSIPALNRLKKLLISHHIDHDAVSFLSFIKEAIEGREYAKFIFTKSLSDVLGKISKLGEENNLCKDDLSYLNIKTIKSLYGSSDSIYDVFAASIKSGKKNYSETSGINLPDLIIHPKDIWSFELTKNEPNYITLQTVRGKVINEGTSRSAFANNILLIPSADPGFDWIFSYNIGGFITMYGGANSHMAIRAGELGIPAVIGAGRALFQQWQKAAIIQINCANRQVQIIR